MSYPSGAACKSHQENRPQFDRTLGVLKLRLESEWVYQHGPKIRSSSLVDGQNNRRDPGLTMPAKANEIMALHKRVRSNVATGRKKDGRAVPGYDAWRLLLWRFSA
jgi:hypothetical protein